MFKHARNKAGLSREEAAFRLHIGTRTLNNYEHHQTIVPPDIALAMQSIYHDPAFTAKYCSYYCPIGQIYAHGAPDYNNLCQAAMGLMKEEDDVSELRKEFITICADGVIDDSELPAFQKIMDELLDLEKKIEEFKIHAASIISLPEMMLERKKPLKAAR